MCSTASHRCHCALKVVLHPVCHSCPTSDSSPLSMEFLLGSFYSAGPKLTAVGSGEQKVAARPLPRLDSGCSPLPGKKGAGKDPHLLNTQWEPQELCPRRCSPRHLLMEGACEQRRLLWGQEGAVLCSELGLPPPVCSMDEEWRAPHFLHKLCSPSAFEAMNAGSGPGTDLNSITDFTQLTESLRSGKTFKIAKRSH